MTPLACLAIALFAGIVLWSLGPILARVLGVVLVLISLAALGSGAALGWLLPLACGFAAWLLGHLMSALKTRYWHSRLAEAIVVHTPLLCTLNPLRPREQPPVPAPVQDDDGLDDFDLWEHEVGSPRRPGRRWRRARSQEQDT